MTTSNSNPPESHATDDAASALRHAIAWALKSGWPTRLADAQIAADVYARWQEDDGMDREILVAALLEAFTPMAPDPERTHRIVLCLLAVEVRERGMPDQ